MLDGKIRLKRGRRLNQRREDTESDREEKRTKEGAPFGELQKKKKNRVEKREEKYSEERGFPM